MRVIYKKKITNELRHILNVHTQINPTVSQCTMLHNILEFN